MPSSVNSGALFQPIKIGRLQLAHRIVMAPLTRYKADDEHVHGNLAVKYYQQRASTAGTMLITEATFISPQAGGYDNVPGIYSPEQIAAWKLITDAVHAKKSFIYLQLWALGRAAKPETLTREGNYPYVSASSIPLKDKDQAPRALTVPEIQQYVKDYAQAARNAIQAGFDGVEIHGANGYIIDQFIQDVSNKRSDEYGGSIERRSRFVLEIVKAVVGAVGEDRTGIRLSPWSIFNEMRMADPVSQFSYIIQTIRDQYPEFAYIHLIEPSGSLPNSWIPRSPDKSLVLASNDPFRLLWAPRPYLSADGHTPESAPRAADEKGDVVVFGRYFISNPDLPYRLMKGIPFTPYNTKTFYGGKELAVGYIDYPFAEEQTGEQNEPQVELDVDATPL